MARPSVNALITRWGIPAVLVLACAVLLPGIGATGLWEPWEMDRASLARTLAAAPEIPVALSDRGDEALRPALAAAAQQAGVFLREEPSDVSEAAGRTARTRDSGLRYALERARTQMVAGVVIDLGVLVDDPERPVEWASAGARVDEALGYVPNGRVILVSTGDGLTADEITSRVALARVREQWKQVAESYALDALPGADDVDRILTERASAADDHLIVLVRPTADELADAFDAASSSHTSIVGFKDGGGTYTVPPLETWLRTASYRVLGVSELATRLPGVLLCLIALWVLMLTARSVWNARVAFFAGLVLLTTPLFFAQARNAAGEPAFLLALTLVGCGLLLRLRGGPVRISWSYLAVGVLIGFLSKGLFALMLFTSLAAAIPLVAGATELRRWLPSLVLAGLFGLAALWVLTSPADGFAGQFRFTQPLFSDGPSIHQRYFDLALRELGFGLFPWAPLVVVALGGALFAAVRDHSRSLLVVALWFIVPLVAVMVMLKDYNQLIWPAAPAAALAVALLFEQILRRGARSYFVALALLVMCFILVRETSKDPAPLVDFLAFDPPFSESGGLAFPDHLRLSGIIVLVSLLAGALAALYFGRVITFGRAALAFFSRKLPYRIALGVFLVLPPIYWLARVGQAHRIAASPANDVALGGTQKAFLSQFASLTEPAVVIAVITAAAVALAIVLRWIIPVTRRHLAAHLRARPLIRPAIMLAAAAAIWLVLAVILAFSVTYPDDWWGETLIGRSSLFAYLGVAVLAWLAWRLTADRYAAIATAVGLLALCFAVHVTRDAGWYSWWVTTLVAIGAIVAASSVIPLLMRSAERFSLGAGVLLSLSLLAIVLPLLDRYTWIEQVLYPESVGYMTRRLVLFSVGTWLCYLAIFGLIVNHHFHRELAPVARRFTVFERGPVVVGALSFAALLATAGTTLGFHARLAENVSQKHIIDRFAEVEGDTAVTNRLFRHGSFAGRGQRDTNFYTATIPEIRDRSAALQVLLGGTDQVTTVETPLGARTTALPGWSAANDADGDGVRDVTALRGFATDVSANVMTDATARWTPGALAGRVLSDISGRSWPIASNTETTLTVDPASGTLPFLPGSGSRAYYVVDGADVPIHTATAETHERRGLLVPALSLSDINYAFRKLSGGRHLPVLDGRSYRVLLATSWLADGEEQGNRLANATYDDASFAALDDPKIKRVWGNFNDEIMIVGYRLDADVIDKGSMLGLTVYYKALGPIRKSYKVFNHNDPVEGGGGRIHSDHWPLNPTRHSDDNKHCNGCFRTDHWLPGDIVADYYEVDTGEEGRGTYTIWLGFFDPNSDKRLPVKDWEKGAVKHDGSDRLGVGTFQVR